MTLAEFLGSSAVAALLAFLANAVRESMSTSRRAVGMLRAALLEIAHADECARAYIASVSTNPIWAPAYRMPTDLSIAALVSLQTDGKLESHEASAIHRFYICASEASRCLDAVAAAAMTFNPNNKAATATALDESKRLRIKCQNVLDAADPARSAIDAFIARTVWPGMDL